jgi:hypothetical protein
VRIDCFDVRRKHHGDAAGGRVEAAKARIHSRDHRAADAGRDAGVADGVGLRIRIPIVGMDPSAHARSRATRLRSRPAVLIAQLAVATGQVGCEIIAFGRIGSPVATALVGQ